MLDDLAGEFFGEGLEVFENAHGEVVGFYDGEEEREELLVDEGAGDDLD